MRGRIEFIVELAAVGILAACGQDARRPDNTGAPPDAQSADATVAHSPRCGYREARDGSNDVAAEPTGLIVGSEPQTLCGTIDTGHFQTEARTVDTDGYRVTVSATTSLVVRFARQSGDGAATEFAVYFFNTDVNPTLLFGGTINPIIGDHGAFLITLPAGTYDVVATTHSASDLATSFGYAIEIAPDGPARCPASTAPASYAEMADGEGADNDVLAVDLDLDPPVQLTETPADRAEPTGLTLDGSTPVRITGTSADEQAEDDYLDRDTYLIRTGATTGELTLRLTWPDAHTNLDYRVFPVDQLTPIGASLSFEGHGEYDVVAVKPDSAYWIWIGGHDGSTSLPAPYDLTICGAELASWQPVRP